MIFIAWVLFELSKVWKKMFRTMLIRARHPGIITIEANSSKGTKQIIARKNSEQVSWCLHTVRSTCDIRNIEVLLM